MTRKDKSCACLYGGQDRVGRDPRPGLLPGRVVRFIAVVDDVRSSAGLSNIECLGGVDDNGLGTRNRTLVVSLALEVNGPDLLLFRDQQVDEHPS